VLALPQALPMCGVCACCTHTICLWHELQAPISLKNSIYCVWAAWLQLVQLQHNQSELTCWWWCRWGAPGC
jgi:hypothetical protein